MVRRLLPLAALALLAACGGGQPTTPPPPNTGGLPTLAKTLHFTPPVTHTRAWRLELVEGQDSGRLLFKVMGPEDQSIQGLSLFLRADPSRIAWASVTPGTALEPGSGIPLFRHRTSPEGALQVGLYRKGGSSRLWEKPLLLIAVQLKTDAPKGPVSLILQPESEVLDATGNTVPLQELALGSLQAR